MRPQTFFAKLATSGREVVVKWRPEGHLPAAWAVYSLAGDPLGLYAVPAVGGYWSQCPSEAWATRPCLVTEGEMRSIDRITNVRDTTETQVSVAVMDSLVGWVRPTHSTLDGYYAVVWLGSVLYQARIAPDEDQISQTELDAAMRRAGWHRHGLRYERPAR